MSAISRSSSTTRISGISGFMIVQSPVREPKRGLCGSCKGFAPFLNTILAIRNRLFAIAGSLWGQMKRLASLIMPFLLSGAAAAAGLSGFLEPVAEHPGLAAATAQLRIEEARLASARDPFSLSIEAGYTSFSVDEPDLGGLPPGLADMFSPPESASRVSADLSLRPFAFGDIADFREQAEAEYALALLSWRETLATLQVNAVTTAQALLLAEDALEVAAAGVELARLAEEATRVRHGNGAANDRELRDAEAGTKEAESLYAEAGAAVDLARLGLESLVGDAELPPREALQLPVPEGEPAGVQRARLQAALAGVGARNARREVLPVVQTGYTHNVTARSSVGVSLESRTLQPQLSWTWESVSRSFPEDLIRGTFHIGVSASISPAITAALRAARAQEEAGGQALAAARRLAATEQASLVNRLEEARRELDIRDLLHRNALASLREAEAREKLGLAIPLETQQEVLALLRAERSEERRVGKERGGRRQRKPRRR